MNNSKNKQSIIFIIPSLDKGGAEKVSLNLAKGISKNNFQINIIHFNKNFDENKIKKNFNINFIYVQNKRFRYSVFKTFRILQKHNPEYIFSSLSHINIYLLVLKFFNLINGKLIIRESNLPSIQIKFSKISRILNFAYKYLYKYSNLIICTSPLMIDQFNQNYNLSLNKLFLLHNPVDVELINKLSLPVKRVKQKCIYFVSIGRLEYQKAFDELIIFFSNIKNIEYKLSIIGDGKEKEKLQNLINHYKLNDKIFLLGHKKNPYNLIANSDIVISLSRWEGMPNSILESLALGKKVIFFDRLKIFDSFKNIIFKNLILIENLNGLKKIFNENDLIHHNTLIKSNLPKNFYINNVTKEFISALNNI